MQELNAMAVVFTSDDEKWCSLKAAPDGSVWPRVFFEVTAL